MCLEEMKFTRSILFNNSGHGLLELLVAMPLLSIILLILGTGFAFSIKSYLVLLSNWELQNQVRLPVERLIIDLDYAEKVEKTERKLRIYCRDTQGTPGWVEYELINNTRPVIVRNTQPLTGGSRLGDIKFYEFDYRIENEKLVMFTISAENVITGKKISLQSAVKISGKGDGS